MYVCISTCIIQVCKYDCKWIDLEIKYWTFWVSASMYDPRTCFVTFCVPFFQTLIILPKVKIMPQNFQHMMLGVYPVHQERHGWPCHPGLRSGTFNVLQVTPFLTPPSWHTSNWDINTKFSGYLPKDQIGSWKTSRMILSSKSPVRSPQRSPTPSFLTPHYWHTYNKHINTKLSGYLP